MNNPDEAHKKADGSGMDAHQAEVAERNAAAKKAGRERRAKYDREQAQRRAEIEHRFSEALRQQG